MAIKPFSIYQYGGDAEAHYDQLVVFHLTCFVTRTWPTSSQSCNSAHRHFQGDHIHQLLRCCLPISLDNEVRSLAFENTLACRLGRQSGIRPSPRKGMVQDIGFGQGVFPLSFALTPCALPFPHILPSIFIGVMWVPFTSCHGSSFAASISRSFPYLWFSSLLILMHRSAGLVVLL
ncbi:hypothetical protein BD289DRAFT_131897 [Coniella lustricola]|uniref:Uncharacterized protein n=1 Tax=Coniella lustricola TaxID=2025994 RepID=A0A2T3AFY2_9PEZI|nr:hypothetical protein BD289DRAFT_131897 [Coniella lustricola]